MMVISSTVVMMITPMLPYLFDDCDGYDAYNDYVYGDSFNLPAIVLRGNFI